MKILNFGSLNIDYVYHVKKFVESGETISSLKLEKFCGGKGMNQSIALVRAGGNIEVYHAGCIGVDGEFLKEELEKTGVNTKYIKTVNQNTGHAIIQLDEKGQNCILIYGGANFNITKDQIDETLKNFNKYDYLLLQNETNNLDYTICRAYDREMKIFFNPSPCNDELNSLPLNKIYCFILNEVEGETLTGEKDKNKIINKLHQKYPQAKIVLTLGKDGVLYFDGEKEYFHDIFNINVVDTTAAGDTFTGYFINELSKNKESYDIIETSSAASAITVSKMGATPSIPYIKEVQELLNKYNKDK